MTEHDGFTASGYDAPPSDTAPMLTIHSLDALAERRAYEAIVQARRDLVEAMIQGRIPTLAPITTEVAVLQRPFWDDVPEAFR